MDVSRLLDSMGEDSRRSSILFGIHSESKALQELERVQRQNRRFSLIAGLAIFLLVAALICLIVYDLYRNRPELIPPQSWQTTEDVDTAPQGDTRRWGKEEEEADMNEEAVVQEKHKNHRYSELVEERTGSKPQPFHLPEEQNSSANHVFPPAPGFTPPVRFRGIYIHPTQHPDERNQEYYQKINDLFTKPQKRPPDNDAVNSDLYTEAVYPSRQANWNRKHTKPGRKPFTVMLDIYPMDKEENPHLVDGQKPRDTIFLPMRQRPAASVQYIPQVMLPPRQQRNRMFMKLNLFPKVRAAQRRTWNMRQDNEDDYEEDYEDDDEDGEEDEEDEEEEDKDEEHSCNGIVGHNPYGKPITAKWKAKNGEWVHAKYVALNQWDDRMDPR